MLHTCTCFWKSVILIFLAGLGTSLFGKPQSAFGTSFNQPQSSGTTSLFGGTSTSTGGSLFGASTSGSLFGQPSTAPCKFYFADWLQCLLPRIKLNLLYLIGDTRRPRQWKKSFTYIHTYILHSRWKLSKHIYNKVEWNLT